MCRSTIAPAVQMLARKSKKNPLAKMVKVILTEDVERLGKSGEVKNVKHSYATNLLVPKGMGQIATEAALNKIAEDEAEAQAASAEAKANAEDNAKVLQAVFDETQGAILKKNVGPTGAIFGSVTPAEVAGVIQDRAGFKVDKKGITVPSITQVGSVVTTIVLHKDVVTKLKVTIVPTSL